MRIGSKNFAEQLVVAELFAQGLGTAPHDPLSRHATMSALMRVWRGELPLPTAFWNWAVAGGLAVNLTTSLAFLVLITQDSPLAALIVGYGLSVPYNIVATVGVWRAAGRYAGPPHWAQAARVATVVGMGVLSVT
ncbi:hypothetical protein [Roseicella aerolata]|uniref:Uncharacterized protein n=1 Tax=Roseicella aerolata TaxID=2883479 RepID=A0A9X1IFE5_9PROT|nr:hypothetical protein [Roseicella aerolata]MCB4823806.1 hypothetical protein [Roseicella aerolata]